MYHTIDATMYMYDISYKTIERLDHNIMQLLICIKQTSDNTYGIASLFGGEKLEY